MRSRDPGATRSSSSSPFVDRAFLTFQRSMCLLLGASAVGTAYQFEIADVVKHTTQISHTSTTHFLFYLVAGDRRTYTHSRTRQLLLVCVCIRAQCLLIAVSCANVFVCALRRTVGVMSARTLRQAYSNVHGINKHVLPCLHKCLSTQQLRMFVCPNRPERAFIRAGDSVWIAFVIITCGAYSECACVSAGIWRT